MLAFSFLGWVGGDGEINGDMVEVKCVFQALYGYLSSIDK